MTNKEKLERLERRYQKQNEYIKQTYDRISVTLPKGSKQWIKDNVSVSCNQFFNDLFREYQERHGTSAEDLPFT